MGHHRDDIRNTLKESLTSRAIDIVSEWLLADYLEGSAPEDSHSTTPESLTTKAS